MKNKKGAEYRQVKMGIVTIPDFNISCLNPGFDTVSFRLNFTAGINQFHRQRADRSTILVKYGKNF
jgi:hypothetical protein